MNSDLLVELGLTQSQALVYLALIEHGASTASQLSGYTGETRTNTYALLARLAELGLAEPVQGAKTVTYRAMSPIALTALAAKQREAAQQREQLLNTNLDYLLSHFHAHTEQPGIRIYQGREEIKKIYAEQLEDGEPIYLVRTPADKDFYDFDYMHTLRNKARRAGIPRHMLTPDSPESPQNYQESDKRMLSKRTWLDAGDYTAPVEWDIYGDRVAIISFGQEAMGVVIDSKQIAESLRQLFTLLEETLPLRADYAELPKLAQYQAKTK